MFPYWIIINCINNKRELFFNLTTAFVFFPHFSLSLSLSLSLSSPFPIKNNIKYWRARNRRMYFRQTWSSVMLIYVKETLALLYILNRFSVLLVPPTWNRRSTYMLSPIKLSKFSSPLMESLNFKSVEFVEAWTVDLGEFHVMVLYGDSGNDILFWKTTLVGIL